MLLLMLHHLDCSKSSQNHSIFILYMFLDNVLYDVGTCLCDLNRSASLGLLAGEYSLEDYMVIHGRILTRS